MQSPLKRSENISEFFFLPVSHERDESSRAEDARVALWTTAGSQKKIPLTQRVWISFCLDIFPRWNEVKLELNSFPVLGFSLHCTELTSSRENTKI